MSVKRIERSRGHGRLAPGGPRLSRSARVVRRARPRTPGRTASTEWAADSATRPAATKVFAVPEEQRERHRGDGRGGEVLRDTTDAASPSSNTTSHSPSQRSKGPSPGDPDDDEGKARPKPPAARAGGRQPAVEMDADRNGALGATMLRSSASRASALRGSRIARRYPAAFLSPCTIAGGALGGQRRHGADRVPDEPLGPPGGLVERVDELAPPSGLERLALLGERVRSWAVAPGGDELRRELPTAPALPGRIHGRLAGTGGRHGVGAGVAGTRRGACLGARPCGPPWRPGGRRRHPAALSARAQLARAAGRPGRRVGRADGPSA